jgi:serine phosphatase RsbU (regulator of sigma subunit)
MKKFILILLLAAGVSMVASDLAASMGDHLEGENHSHSILEIFSGESDDSIVCYKKSHRNTYFGIFALVLALSGVVFNRYKIKKRLASQLEMKNRIIEEKNRDIVSSIRYARRIQSAILPPDEVFGKYFSDCFILYKPKDIVSGDFYWVAEKNGKILVAAVDCTGHGVPGAFLSIVGNNSLNKIVNQNGITRPSEILDALNEEVVEVLRHEANPELKDGMDIALCSVDRLNGKMEYAGAFNPLWKMSDGNLTEVKADRVAIGLKGKQEKYANHEVNLRKGDVFYIFTDGYADQFGGKDSKKFKLKQLRELVVSIHQKPLPEQKSLLDRKFEEWKQNHDQVDDILVIGIRV